LGAQDVVMRLSYAAAERMFVDFSGDRAPWFDPEGGEEHIAEVFVAVLGCSGKLDVQATASQDLASWVGAHVGAWEAFGGLSEVTVPDNLRAGVSKACFYDPEINPTYAELAAFSVLNGSGDGGVAYQGAPAPGHGRGGGRCAGRAALAARPAAQPTVLLPGRAERGHRH